uniref:Sm domain-containing protein n=1 Tax=Caenorhabditis tropicalis TaxID=1561998 RepID=A0A1I7TRB5_9PELO
MTTCDICPLSVCLLIRGADVGVSQKAERGVFIAIQWFLVETRTEIATGNKAKIFGGVFDSNMECVVSFIQEAYIVPGKPLGDSKL